MVTVSLTGASKEDAATVFGVLRTAVPTDRPSDPVPQEQPGDHPAVWTAQFEPAQHRMPTGPPPPLEGSPTAVLQAISPWDHNRWRCALMVPGWSASLPAVLGKGVSDKGVCVTVPESVCGLEPGDEFHMPGQGRGADDGLPLCYRAAVLLLDRREVAGRALHGFSHVAVSHPSAQNDLEMSMCFACMT